MKNTTHKMSRNQTLYVAKIVHGGGTVKDTRMLPDGRLHVRWTTAHGELIGALVSR